MTQPDLFNVEESLSPQLAYIRKYGLVVDQPMSEDYPAFVVQHKSFALVKGVGDSLDDALEDFAIQNGLPVWNAGGQGECQGK